MKLKTLRWSVLAVVAGAVQAQDPAALVSPPGRLLASQCAQCHGTDGNAVSGFESIAGEDDIYGELMEMKRKSVPESIMDRQARGYTDEQIRLIADYLRSIASTGGDDD
jgi:sulfide dehydrogenase cytochrome subunit